MHMSTRQTGPRAMAASIPASGRFRMAALSSGIACSVLILLGAGPARADWTRSALDARCDPADITGVSNSVRNAIEASVRRAEATIQAPAPIADLSCLSDLMTTPIDIFSNIGGLAGTFQAGLFDSLPFSMDMDVSGMVCDFAAERWGELTGGLSGLGADLSQFANTPASMTDRLAGGGGFGSGSGGTGSTGTLGTSLTGSGSTTMTNTPTGTSPIDLSSNLGPVNTPLMPVAPEGFVFLEPQYLAAMDSFQSLQSSAFLEFMTCEVDRRINPFRDLGGEQGIELKPECTMPNVGAEPNVNDFIVPVGSPMPLMSPLSSAPATPGRSTVTEPSQLIQPSTPRSTQSPAGRSSQEDDVNSIWRNL